MIKLVAMVNIEIFLQSGSSFAFGRFVSRGLVNMLEVSQVASNFKPLNVAQMFANSQASFRLFNFHVVYQLANGTSEQNCASLGRTSQNDLLSGLYGHSWTPQFFV